MPNENTDDDMMHVRWIASEIEKRSPLISAFGGLESFSSNNPKVEWVVDGADSDARTFGLEYNYNQEFSVGVIAKATSDDAIAELTAMIEQTLIGGVRYVGDGIRGPNLAGGILYFLTEERGARITDGDGAPLQISDLDDMLAALPAEPEPILLCGARAGSYLKRMKWSKAQRLYHPCLPRTDILILRKQTIKIGHHGTWGRPHVRRRSPIVGGTCYADLTFVVNSIEKMGRLTGFRA